MANAENSTAIALTIAGSDSGGGAGIQADLKTFSALGVYGASVITAITAQNTQAVTAVHNVPTDIIRAQIKAVLDDLDVNSIKIGMLSSVEIIEAVASEIAGKDIPIVLDPVMVAKSGDRLLADDALGALRQHLLPLATILTPNLPEAADLLGTKESADPDDMAEQGRALLELGPQAVLMKGGHGTSDKLTDLLILKSGKSIALEASRHHTSNTHGTGCSISSAIAAGLAKGLDLEQAVEEAHQYLQNAIRAADDLTIGSGHGPVHHFWEYWS
jgi:hydroxymethylpyrimidine/phosphomethylpyrimidine kinase